MEPGKNPHPPGRAGRKDVLSSAAAQSGSSQLTTSPVSATSGTDSQGRAASTTPGSLQIPTLDATAFATGKGGGALRSIDEKFSVSPSTGTLSLRVPLPISNGRNGFQPSLHLEYDSGNGNGPFGLGWQMGMGSIARQTSYRIPQYGADDDDVFVHSGGEDLVPVAHGQAGEARAGYHVREYRLRVEQDRALRVERWSNTTDGGDVYWRSVSGDDNVTRIYGRDDSSRIFQSAVDGSKRISSWLLCEAYDAFGNAMHCAYKTENGQGVTADGPGASFISGRDTTAGADNAQLRMRYLKSVKYGNQTPCRSLDSWNIDKALLGKTKWCYEVVLDYGEHDVAVPTPADDAKPWAVRLDPFLACKVGFELRTYRLCRRLLMFHHFEELGKADYLVASSTLEYDERPSGSLLRSISTRGHIWDAAASIYITESLAPVTLQYSGLPDIAGAKMQTTKPACLQSLVVPSPDATTARWLDLDGDGTQGLLVQVSGAWYYQRNEMAADPGMTTDPGSASDSEPDPDVDDDRHHLVDGFGPIRRLGAFPNFSNYSKVSFGDLDGNGKQDMIVVDDRGRDAAYCERLAGDGDGDAPGWTPLRPFPAILNRRLDGGDVKRVDLTGDGQADVLVVDNESGETIWHESLGKDGFSSERRCHPGRHPGLGRPRHLGAGRTDAATYLVDMSGDGLEDIAEISNGSVSYWPNLGHGQFGSQIVMANAPAMARDDLFDVDRLRLLDVDGSGALDMIYLLPDGGAMVYFNLCGSSWSEGVAIPQFPRIEHLSAVFALDMLGKGTSCLCWTGPDAGAGSEPVIHYLDLAGAGKPYLLTSFSNGTGQETKMLYQPSTRFSLGDERAGRPWTTRLPFPVHVVRKVVVRDAFSAASRVTKYAYHDGYFDGHDKVFRGFAMVEMWEHEEHVLMAGRTTRSRRPVRYKKMWFHTGSADLPAVLPGTFGGQALVRTVMPAATGWNARYQTARALKGKPMRVEEYGLDGSAKAAIPYSTADITYDVENILPPGPRDRKRPGVFRVSAKEKLSCTYERDGGDPRMDHELILERNAYGDVTKKASLYYGRKKGEDALDARSRQRQQENRLVYVERGYTDPTETKDDFYKPRLASTKKTHVLGLQLAGTVVDIGRACSDPVSVLGLDAPEEPAGFPSSGIKGPRRLRGKETQILYRSADMTGPLGPGKIDPGPVIMVDQEFELALTPRDTDAAYGPSSERLLGSSLAEVMKQGGYQELSGWDSRKRAFTGHDNCWWAPSPRVMFPKIGAVEADSALAKADSELARARLCFFAPSSRIDAFGKQSTVEMDRYSLLPVRLVDPAGNTTVATNDYRTVQAAIVTDANGNRTGVRYGPLGGRVGLARMGKEAEQVGDELEPDANLAPSPDTLRSLIENPTSASAKDLLMRLGTRWLHSRQPMQVDTRLLPPFRVELSRTQHAHDGQDGSPSPGAVTMSVTYLGPGSSEMQTSRITSWEDSEGTSAGSGNTAKTQPKQQQQWTNTGCAVFSTAGQVVKQYHPFFAPDALYRPPHQITTEVPATLHFADALGRQVGTLHPDLTWSKTTRTAWSQTDWAAGDTIAIADPRLDPEVGFHFRALDQSAFSKGWLETSRASSDARSRLAAERSASGVSNPVISHLDCVGRPVYRVEGDSTKSKLTRATASDYNVYGDSVLEVDSLTRIVQQSQFDRMKKPIVVLNMDAGAQVAVFACDGRAVLECDGRGVSRRTVYDGLRRPVETRVREAAGQQPEYVLCRITYGEVGDDETEAKRRNLRGRVASVADQSGIRTIMEYDFKGNALRSTMQLARDYKGPIDWAAKDVALLPEIYKSRAAYDALNRAYQTVDALGRETSRVYDLLSRLAALKTRRLGQDGISSDWIPHITDARYTADGLASSTKRGNGSATGCEYDPATRKLLSKTTVRQSDGARLEDLSFTYDCYGRIVRLTNAAQETIFFRNNRVEPTKDYFYDQWGRLVRATGREMVSGSGPGSLSLQDASSQSNPLAKMGLSNSGRQMVSYDETYTYDDANNILQLQHEVSDAATAGWTRKYLYQEASLVEPARKSNRLSKTDISGVVDEYGYDTRGRNNAGLVGCITLIPGFARLEWDASRQLKAAIRKGAAATPGDDKSATVPETTYFVYNSDGVRIRKVTERAGPSDGQGVKLKETLFLDAAELQLRYGGDGTTVRSTIATSLVTSAVGPDNDSPPLVLVESRLDADKPPGRTAPVLLQRYSLSPSLEVDDQARVVSWEEYSPYGTSTVASCRADVEAPSRYRFASYRRDSETGFYHCGARYYLPGLGRWLSPDPLGTADGLNLYCYCVDDPVNRVDPTGGCNDRQDQHAIGINIDQPAAGPPGPNRGQRFMRDHPTAAKYLGKAVKGTLLVLTAAAANTVITPLSTALNDGHDPAWQHTFGASAIAYTGFGLAAWGAYKAGKAAWNWYAPPIEAAGQAAGQAPGQVAGQAAGQVAGQAAAADPQPNPELDAVRIDIAAMRGEITALRGDVAELRDEIAENNREIAVKDGEIAAKNLEIAGKDKTIKTLKNIGKQLGRKVIRRHSLR